MSELLFRLGLNKEKVASFTKQNLKPAQPKPVPFKVDPPEGALPKPSGVKPVYGPPLPPHLVGPYLRGLPEVPEGAIPILRRSKGYGVKQGPPLPPKGWLAERGHEELLEENQRRPTETARVKYLTRAIKKEIRFSYLAGESLPTIAQRLGIPLVLCEAVTVSDYRWLYKRKTGK